MENVSKDMIVDLYQPIINEVDNKYEIKRVLSPNSDRVLDFIETHFSKGWVSEAKAGLYKNNPTCFIAVDDGNIIGFACYDATAKGYCGPTGVDKSYRGQSVGKALLLHTLTAMRYDGYGYAIIGGVNTMTRGFYSKSSGAVEIDNSKKIYQRMI